MFSLCKVSPRTYALVVAPLLTCAAGVAPAQEKSVALTVYHDNLALVREVRTLEIQKGESEVAFQDVAAHIDPTSVYFTSLTAPDQVAILEQNFEFDLVNASKILAKYVDQEIELRGKDGLSYSGTLLSASGSEIILRRSDGRIKIVSRGQVQHMDFPRLPEGLITRPTLVWKLRSTRNAKHRVEVGYLTSGIKWHAEYVAVTNQGDTQLELSAWVSLDNKSGASYENAKLKLVAGDVHRARRELEPLALAKTMVRAAEPDQFREKAFFEYHLYTLDRPTTVANNQIKQISLFPPTEVPVTKKYSYNGARDKRLVRVNLEFENRKAAGLGKPLPEGKIRVYKRDDDGALVLVGEDFIEHTPKDEKVRVYVGNAFDLVGERVQKERRTISRNTHEETWEIKLRNHKDKAVEITVVERFQPGWEILRSTHEYKQKDALTVEFHVNVPKDGETVVEYQVRYNR